MKQMGKRYTYVAAPLYLYFYSGFLSDVQQHTLRRLTLVLTHQVTAGLKEM